MEEGHKKEPFASLKQGKGSLRTQNSTRRDERERERGLKKKSFEAKRYRLCVSNKAFFSFVCCFVQHFAA